METGTGAGSEYERDEFDMVSPLRSLKNNATTSKFSKSGENSKGGENMSTSADHFEYSMRNKGSKEDDDVLLGTAKFSSNSHTGTSGLTGDEQYVMCALVFYDHLLTYLLVLALKKSLALACILYRLYVDLILDPSPNPNQIIVEL